jgi:sec-independent protein translocase protein TatC
VNVVLGSAVAFETPVAVFFLTLLRIATPSFLLRNARYAVLAIAVIAALLTPSPNIFDMAMVAAPMILLYFLGVFASYLLTLRRSQEPFPWIPFLVWTGIVGLVGGGGYALARRRSAFLLK